MRARFIPTSDLTRLGNQAAVDENVRMAIVLIAERDGDLRRLYAAVVRGMGHEAAFAVDLGQPGRADVLLVEPAQSECLEVAEWLRQQRPELPIVCASIHDATPEATFLAPSSYLLKPFSLLQLNEALEAAIDQAAPHRAALCSNG
jgi:CheY-like chemotaxis protein